MAEILARIVANRFVAGIVLRDGVVVKAAPIVRRQLMGMTRDQVREIAKFKGWKINIVDEK